MIASFYNELAAFYHLIYPDWESSIERQATNLTSIMHEFWGEQTSTILDAACGIGTQSLGLAQRGFTVTASDLSAQAIERAQHEAQQRHLEIAFSVADMREVFNHHRRTFDVVIACDNSIPHLLTDADIQTAFEQFYHCTRPGGGCLISVRDYAALELGGVQVHPFGLRVEGQHRYFIFQVWEFQGSLYDLSMYFIKETAGAECQSWVFRSKYYAVTIEKLMSLLRQAGFEQVQRLAARFFQPVIIGTKPKTADA